MPNDGCTVAGVEIYKDELHIRGEVEPCVEFTDRAVLQLEVSRGVVSQNEPVPACQHQTVHLVPLLLHYQVGLGPESFVFLKVLILQPLGEISVVLHLGSELCENFPKGVQTREFLLVEDHAPEGVSLSSPAVAVDELAVLGGEEFESQVLVPLEFVSVQSQHHLDSPLVPVGGALYVPDYCFELFGSLRLRYFPAQGDVVGPGSLEGGCDGGVEEALEVDWGREVDAEKLVVAREGGEWLHTGCFLLLARPAFHPIIII